MENNQSNIDVNNNNDFNNIEGMQNIVQKDYYDINNDTNNNDSYYNNNYESNYSDKSFQEPQKKGNGIGLKILIVILALLIIIVLILKFCVGKGESLDKKYTALKNRICNAAETYVTNNPTVLDKTIPGKTVTIKYRNLSDANLIETQIVNPYYKTGLFVKNTEEKFYSLDNSVRLSVGSDFKINCELVDNSQDVTAPVMRLNGNAEVTLGVGTEFEDPMATATDDYDGDLTDKIVRSGNVDLAKAGEYELTYTVSDSAGNISTIKRKIIYEEFSDLEVSMGSILDSVTPMISLKGSNPFCMVKGTKYVEPGATATDNVDGNLSDKISVTNKITGNLIGSFRITYKVEDTSGNQAIAYRSVIVSTECPGQEGNDNTANTAPKITLGGLNSVTVTVGTEYIDLGATAYDKEDGDITNKIVTDTTNVNTSKPGTYKVVYKVTDSGDLTTYAERIVTVNSTSVAGTPSVRIDDKKNITVVVGEGNDDLITPPKAVNENNAPVNVARRIENADTKVNVTAINWNEEGKYRVIFTATHANGIISQSDEMIVTIVSDKVAIGGKDAINVDVRTSNCNISQADLENGGVTFTSKSTKKPVIEIENKEDKACKTGTYEINVIATTATGNKTSKKITIYVVNGEGKVVNENAPSKVQITSNSANTYDSYNKSGNWVGGATTAIELKFSSTPVSGTEIAKYEISYDCSDVNENASVTSNTTGFYQTKKIGKNSLCVRAVTKDEIAGEWSDPVNVYIDTEGPKIEFTHEWADGESDWHNSTALTLSYKGNDELSGVDHFEYTYDDVKVKESNEIVTMNEPSGSLTISENTEPTRPRLYVYVRAVDRAGNMGEWVSNPAYVNIDTTKPGKPTIKIEENKTKLPKIVATAEDVKNTVTNRQSSIGKFNITLTDSSNNSNNYSTPATIDEKNQLMGSGTFQLPANSGTEDQVLNAKVWAVDRAGNISDEYAEDTITVRPGSISATGITLKNGTKEIEDGANCFDKIYLNKEITLTATPLPADADDKTATWSMEDETIATVDANGKVKGIKVGTTTLTAKIGNYTKSCIVNVKKYVAPAPVPTDPTDSDEPKLIYRCQKNATYVDSYTSVGEKCTSGYLKTIPENFETEGKYLCTKYKCSEGELSGSYCIKESHTIISGWKCLANSPR